MEKGCQGKNHMVIYLLQDFYKTISFMRPWKILRIKVNNVKYGQVHRRFNKWC